MLKKILEKSRFLVIIAVIGSLMATLALLGFGIYYIGDLIFKIGNSDTLVRTNVRAFEVSWLMLKLN
jgi:uncharacterized membrane protein YqhA